MSSEPAAKPQTAGRIVVFLGPSLPLPRARALLPEATFLPPVAQGDLYRLTAPGRDLPRAIGVIDGVFKDQPTLRHREVLWALSRGVAVYGAASMGALRAGELAGQGMVPVGLIARWYRRYDLLPDDAVAVTHAPPELGAAPLSDALVDLRRSFARAARAGAISRAEARHHSEIAARTPFAARRLPDALAPYRVDQKARDARALLTRLADQHRRGEWPRPDTAPPPLVHAWLDDLAAAGLPAPD